MVVDDDAAIRAVLERVLRLLGCRVVPAESAAQARELVTLEPNFALVIVDLGLGDADGLELVVELRDALRYRTPFAIYSGMAPRGPLPAGVVAVIPKPSGVTELMTAIQAAILAGWRGDAKATRPSATSSGTHARTQAAAISAFAEPSAAAERLAEPRDPSQSGTRARAQDAVAVIEHAAPASRRDHRRQG